jgi:hypothetical protein
MLLSKRRLKHEPEITLYSTAVTICTINFKIRQILHIAHTIHLRGPYESVNSDSPKHHWPANVYNGDAVCLL